MLLIDAACASQRRLVIAGHNLHSTYLSHTNAEFKEFYAQADLVLIDGMPVLRLLNRDRKRSGAAALSASHRLGSTDWIMHALELSSVERICVVGATRESNDSLVGRLRAERPHVNVLGIPADPWSEAQLADVVARIRAFEPELVLLGLGMPLQESVCAKLIDSGIVAVFATVGGAIDQLSGKQPLAPRWVGILGVEWLWRLVGNPRRLAGRYIVEPAKLIRLLRRIK